MKSLRFYSRLCSLLGKPDAPPWEIDSNSAATYQGIAPADLHALLHLAAQEDRVKAAKALIAAGAPTTLPPESSLSFKANKRWAPLVAAVNNGNVEMVELLLAHTHSAVEWSSLNLLESAAMSGRERMVACLLQHGAPVDLQNSQGQSALSIAAAQRRLPVVLLLIQNGAFINQIDGLGNTALHKATSIGCVEVMLALLKAGAAVDAVNQGGQTPLAIAIKNQRRRTLRPLIEHEPIRVVEVLLQSGAIYDKDELAALLRQPEFIQKLRRDSKSADGAFGVYEYFECLIRDLDLGKPSQETATLKRLSMQMVCRSIILNKYDDDALLLIVQDGLSRELAAAQKHALLFSLAAMAIKHCPPARVNKLPGKGTPFYRELKANKLKADYGLAVQTIRTLRNRPDLISPLNYAIEQCNVSLVKSLLRYGASAVLPDSCGNTPLHVAVATGDLQFVDLLLKHGARNGAPDLKNRSARKLAQDLELTDIAQMLGSHA